MNHTPNGNIAVGAPNSEARRQTDPNPGTCTCCQRLATLTRADLCPDCEAIAQRIPPARIIEMYDNRSRLTGNPVVKWPTKTERGDEEYYVVSDLWERIPNGASSWMSAFYILLRRARIVISLEALAAIAV